MLNFTRLTIAAVCTTGYTLEMILQEHWMFLNIAFQLWIFLEWLGYKYSGKANRHDFVLTDLVPFLAQLLLMIKVIR